MGSGHRHSDTPPSSAPRNIRVILAACVAPFAVAVVVGLIVLWPPPITSSAESQGTPGELIDATVVSTNILPCGVGKCQSVVIEPSDGPERGKPQALATFALEADIPVLDIGEAIVVQRGVNPVDQTVNYNFADRQRSASLAWLAVIFAVIVVAVARLRGIAALVGLAFSYLVIVRFLLPALVVGKPAIAVALVAAGAIMFVILYLAHGFNARTTTALLGTLVSLVAIGVLSQLFVYATRLSGLTSEEATYVKAQVGQIDLKGLLLAGIIIGALGVLNDVTVTQASAVWEIHDANPARGWRDIYGSGMRVGRDHIASTVDTLVLAYAGASLPLLIIFSLGAQPLTRIVTGELVAEEVVRTLVGSIGLVLSVPLTTIVAAVVVTRSAHAHRAHHDDHPATDGPDDAAAIVLDRPADDAADDEAADDDSDTIEPAEPTPDPAPTGRRAGKRSPARAKAWERPKAEREFWGDDA